MNKKFLTLTIAALVSMLLVFSGCELDGGSSSSSGGEPEENSAEILFTDATLEAALTAFGGTAATGDKGSIVDLDGGGSYDAATNTATFSSYPSWWDGGIAYALLADGATGRFDLSGVASITFEIKSDVISPDELAFFIQWQDEAAPANGGEYTASIGTDLGAADITSWTTVTVDTSTIVDEGRYAHTSVTYTGTGDTQVDDPFAIKWFGSAGTDPNTGPLVAGESYMIRNITFLDGSGNPVDIAASVTAVP